jgi:uncharacterized protein (DUF2236 family)
MDALRRWMVDDFEKGAGRHDDPAIYHGPPGDPGLIGPGSMSWEINADLASVSQAGLPAIVLEILHPSVIAGVQDLSNYREDPFQRARATLGYVLATTFGNTEAATAVIERVKQIHSFVTGIRPDGVPYRALDPDLIAWVHICIPWMILRVYEETKRPLSQHEKDRYLWLSRMTAYRRYPRRDDLVEALVRRETQRFLGAVADAIESAAEPNEGVAAAFIAAVSFARVHPILRRAAHSEPAPIADSVELLKMGSALIANYIHGEEAGEPSQQVRWVADVFARLFFTYISMPPTDPDFTDDAELRRFAHEVLTPMVERAVG